MLWKDFHGIGYPFRFSLGSEDSVTSVMGHSRSQVPSLGAVGVPGPALAGLFVNDYFCSGRREGCFIVVECAFEEGVGGHVWIPSRGSE